MTVQAIQQFLEARPFRPFTLGTASGQIYSVPHPEFLYFTPSRRVAHVFTDAERFDALDVLTITEVRHGGTRAKPKRRGK